MFSNEGVRQHTIKKRVQIVQGGKDHRGAAQDRLMYSALEVRSCRKLILIKIWLLISWFLRAHGSQQSNRKPRWTWSEQHCQQVSHSQQIELLGAESRSQSSIQGKAQSPPEPLQSRTSSSKSRATTPLSQVLKSMLTLKNLKILPHRCLLEVRQAQNAHPQIKKQ